ncbi:MAG: hypothetical protein LAO04_11960 [Acidobacteriia bacterium]|nr:hypothetical protein [Terriglobia bacterium]
MTKEHKSRSVRIADFVAETLEEGADHLPSSQKAKAKYLPNTAKIMRELGSPKVITILDKE